MKKAIRLVERGLVPDMLVRLGIRRLLRERLRGQAARYGADRDAALAEWAEQMRAGPVALLPDVANQQHYEVPPEFFRLVLGPRLKYSSAFYPRPDASLAEAEDAMLRMTCERAGLADGQRVLELGCGWGSLTLWMAEHYPGSKFVAVSNSALQRRSIEASADARGLANLSVVTCDMNEFDTRDTFDRIVSVEMFEHMRNWEELLRRAARWLRPEGRVFLHVFAHARYAYPFEVHGESDWMSRYFFSGGMMPCHDLLDSLDVPFETEERWRVSGEHYARTAEHWLENLDARREQVLEVFRGSYGATDAGRWLQRWRVFFMACAELFATDGGAEWHVTHQRLRPKGAR